MDEQSADKMTSFMNNASGPIQMALAAGAIVFIIFWFVMFAVMFGGATVMFSAVGGPRIPIEGMIFPCLIFWVFLGFFGYYLLHALAGRHLLVKLDKLAYVFGEQINGSITIDRDINKQARSLTVSFYGLERQGKRMEKVCVKEIMLSGARTFRKGEVIPFSISMPDEVKDYIGANDPLKGDKYLGVALGMSHFRFHQMH